MVLEGEPPALAGWTLAAIVDHRGAVSAIRFVCSIAPPLDPTAFGEPHCDHCRLRRRRVETFVLWHADPGRLRQVGTGCMRDFLDGHDPERLCRQADYVVLARHELNAAAAPIPSVVASTEGIPLDGFAAHAAMVVRAHGWVSREQARRSSRPASADAALDSLQHAPDAPRAADWALAPGAVHWTRELLVAKCELSEFERDAVAVVSGRTVLTRGSVAWFAR